MCARPPANPPSHWIRPRLHRQHFLPEPNAHGPHGGPTARPLWVVGHPVASFLSRLQLRHSWKQRTSHFPFSRLKSVFGSEGRMTAHLGYWRDLASSRPCLSFPPRTEQPPRAGAPPRSFLRGGRQSVHTTHTFLTQFFLENLTHLSAGR